MSQQFSDIIQSLRAFPEHVVPVIRQVRELAAQPGYQTDAGRLILQGFADEFRGMFDPINREIRLLEIDLGKDN